VNNEVKMNYSKMSFVNFAFQNFYYNLDVIRIFATCFVSVSKCDPNFRDVLCFRALPNIHAPFGIRARCPPHAIVNVENIWMCFSDSTHPPVVYANFVRKLISPRNFNYDNFIGVNHGNN